MNLCARQIPARLHRTEKRETGTVSKQDRETSHNLQLQRNQPLSQVPGR